MLGVLMAKKSFKGNVEVYDQSFYVDTDTGEGVDKVLKKIDPLLCKKASTTFITGYNFEDIKHELVIIAMDGIKKFDATKGVKLSTFLHVHLQNKLISRLRSENKLSNDAFGLYGRQESDAKIKKARDEINFSQFVPPEGMEGVSFENSIADDGGLYFPGKNAYDKVEFEVSLKKISKKLDYRTRKIIELVYFKDYSIKDAAEAVGLSGWAASMRLKKLANKRSFQSVFGQLDERNGKGL
jgi:RNA polymerase sigma factor (sigma-70 family)